MKQTFVMLMVVVGVFGQDQPQTIQDLKLLIGKQVTVQRWPLCQSGTYTTVLTYAGKQAKVVSLKPSTVTPPSQQVLDRLTPALRAKMEEIQKSATILVQFEDGTQLDSCGPVAPGKLADHFELVPGQSLEAVSPSPPATTPTPPVAAPAATPAAAATVTPAQPPDMLSDDEVKQALNGKGKDHVVTIEDAGWRASQGKQVPRIILYMPESVLAIDSEIKRKQFTQYQPTEESKRRSLQIIAQGYAGNTITEGCTSITRIVLLSDPSGGVVKEAYLSEPLKETWRNNYGATNECQALCAKFSLDDVHKVKAAAPDGEFFVAVFAGSHNTKMYKIKKKHQSKLALE